MIKKKAASRTRLLKDYNPSWLFIFLKRKPPLEEAKRKQQIQGVYLEPYN